MRRVFDWPFKVVAFSWKVFLDHIPTRINIAKRKVIPSASSLSCVFCNDPIPETSLHLFLYCQVAWSIWVKVMEWIGFHFITPQNLFFSFNFEKLSLFFFFGFWTGFRPTNDTRLIRPGYILGRNSLSPESKQLDFLLSSFTHFYEHLIKKLKYEIIQLFLTIKLVYSCWPKWKKVIEQIPFSCNGYITLNELHIGWNQFQFNFIKG